MPLEGGIYQWAKIGFNEFAGFMVAWNVWLLSITVIALGGMFVTTNISYAIGESAAWMPNSKWCVSLISSVLVIGLGWTAIRGLALGKWVHNIGGLVMLLVYGALIALPFIALARGELRQYQPLQIAAPTVSMFYCLNIFSKLAIGALSGFESLHSCRRNALARTGHRSLGHHRLSHYRFGIYSGHELSPGIRWQ